MAKNTLETLGNRTGSLWMSPFRELAKMQADLDRLFQGFMETPTPTRVEAEFSPSCEIKEDKKNYLLRFDIPGVQKEQVKIEVDKGILTVSAERREEKKSDDEKTHSSEIFYGSYMRSLTLPNAIDEKKIDAKFDNGVLTITIPKTDISEAKRIAIH